MADYDGMEALLASAENLTQLLNNVGHDDDTLTFDGVGWFKFNGTVAQNIYVSGNSWFGFGTNAEQLRVCRRDAKLWNFWREEGTLYNCYKFLRLKWDGYAQYNSTSDSVHLTYEVYLFSTGDIFLNVLRMPTDSIYLGTNQLICTGGTKTFTVTAGQALLYWQDSQDEPPVLEADVTALPFPQTVITEDVDMVTKAVSQVFGNNIEGMFFCVAGSSTVSWSDYFLPICPNTIGGVFTIVEEASGTGATRWGLLKSYQAGRNGWISLIFRFPKNGTNLVRMICSLVAQVFSFIRFCISSV